MNMNGHCSHRSSHTQYGKPRIEPGFAAHMLDICRCSSLKCCYPFGAGPQCFVGNGKDVDPHSLQRCCAPTYKCTHDPTTDYDYCCALPHLAVVTVRGSRLPVLLHATVIYSAVQSV